MELNNHWINIPLEDLTVHVIGGDWGKESDFIEDGYEAVACIRGSEFKHWKIDFGRTAVIRKIKISSMKTRALLKGDILVEISGGGPEQPVGRTVLISDTVLKQHNLPVVCTNFIRMMRLAPCINSVFVNRYLELFYLSGEVIKYQGGSNNLRNLKFKDYSKINIPLPSYAEQKIIADKLDDLLARVESIKTRLENIPEILKKFRQSVLSAAVSGKLTESNDSLKSKESYQWSERKLSEVGLLSRGKSKHRPRNDPRLYGNNYPFIQTSEITNSFGRVKESKKFYSEFGLSQSKLFPKGTLCITIAANIADTAILDIDACFPDSIVGFIPYEEKANVIFIKYLIDVNKDYLEASAPATAQKNINLKVLSELKILLPSIKEQNRIVILVEDTLSQISFIERTTNDALNRVNHLTQSILAKAFRGELTAQWREENPELISGLNSAEALLEKITAEKLAAGTLKKRAKKTSH